MSAAPPASGAAPADGGRAAAPGRRVAHAVSYALLLGVAAFLFVIARDLPESRWEPLGAGAFPRLVLGVLMAIAGLALADELRRLWRDRSAARPPRPGAVVHRYRLVALVLAGFVVYVLALPVLGFSVASLAFLAAIQLALGPKHPRAIAIMALVAVVFSFGLNALFAEVFNVFLPRGRLFG